MKHTWESLMPDERTVLEQLRWSRWPEHWSAILRRVRNSHFRTRRFGEARLRRTLRMLQDKNLAVQRGRGMWVLHIEGQQLLAERDRRHA